jgi:hypothetical protein
MQVVPLTAVANQTIDFNADGAYWTIHIYQAKTQVYADIKRSGTLLMSGIRCLGGIPLLPYKHMYLPTFGNFIFDTDADWTLFEDSCNLYYLTLDELTEYLTSYNSAVIS